MFKAREIISQSETVAGIKELAMACVRKFSPVDSDSASQHEYLNRRNWAFSSPELYAFDPNNTFDSQNAIVGKQAGVNEIPKEREICFNELSAMVVSAFVPLTNIRWCSFQITLADKTPPTTNYINALLTDSAITGNYNKREESRTLISTIEDFLTYNDCESKIQAVRAASRVISLSDVSALSAICSATVDYIRQELSCVFADGVGGPATVIYHDLSNKDSNEKETTIGSDYTLLSYQEVFPGDPNEFEFGKWRIELNGNVTRYDPGANVFITQPQIHVYAERYDGLVVRYVLKDSTKNTVDRTPTGQTYVFKNISQTDLSSKMPGDCIFKGWSENKDSPVVKHSAGSRIVAANITITLYAVVAKVVTQILTTPRIDIYNVPNSSGFDRGLLLNLNGQIGNTTLGAALVQLTSLHFELKNLVGFKLFDRMKGTGFNKDDRAYVNVNVLSTHLIDDRWGTAKGESTANGILIFKANNSAVNSFSAHDILSKGDFGDQENWASGASKPPATINQVFTDTQLRNFQISWGTSGWQPDTNQRLQISLQQLAYINVDMSTKKVEQAPYVL